ncbi:4Fe-4S binding protein [Candidatus Bathyarchaeota archaeon]|nr:4Fe-4S binding protein [Candidatus Bathyarchaeota archaeon]
MPRWEVLAPGLIEFGPTPGGKNIGFTTSFERYLRPQVDRGKCTDCKLCHHYCPDGAMGFEAVVDLNYCTGCGICSEVCPVKAISMVGEWEAEKGLREEELLTIEEALREYMY